MTHPQPPKLVQRGDVVHAVAQQSMPQTHVVQAGQSLASIAKRYTGSAAEWSRIAAANAHQSVKGRLRQGVSLIIPRRSA